MYRSSVRSPVAFHVPSPTKSAGSNSTYDPSAWKTAYEVLALGSSGLLFHFHIPTIGWLAVSAAASCADTGRVVVASARPRPPAPSPARAVRREMVSAV